MDKLRGIHHVAHLPPGNTVECRMDHQFGLNNLIYESLSEVLDVFSLWRSHDLGGSVGSGGLRFTNQQHVSEVVRTLISVKTALGQSGLIAPLPTMGISLPLVLPNPSK